MTEARTEIAPPRPRAAGAVVRRRRPGGRAAVPPPPSTAAALRPAEALRARLRLRHWLVILSFLALFVAPAALVNLYLQFRAADQYVSRAAMTVASDQFQSSQGMFADLYMPPAQEASDTDILYAYIFSPEMVARVAAAIDVRALWRKPAERDFWYALGPDDSIEALVAYWPRMVRVTYEARQGILGLEVRAFAPEDARAIAERIVAEARDLVNRLSEAALADAIRYSRAELDEARARLEAERQRLRSFRDENRIILPEAEVAGQTGLLNVLQSLLAEALIERARLLETTRPGDPRLAQAERRIDAITRQVAEERRRLAGDAEGATIVARLGRFEELSVELDLAQRMYLAARAAHDAARAEAARLSRYVRLHIAPTLAGAPTHPERLTIGASVTILLLVGWTVLVLVAYNIRDTRRGP